MFDVFDPGEADQLSTLNHGRLLGQQPLGQQALLYCVHMDFTHWLQVGSFSSGLFAPLALLLFRRLVHHHSRVVIIQDPALGLLFARGPSLLGLRLLLVTEENTALHLALLFNLAHLHGRARLNGLRVRFLAFRVTSNCLIRHVQIVVLLPPLYEHLLQVGDTRIDHSQLVNSWLDAVIFAPS